MLVELTVAVATFGDESWANLARERAIPSAELQAPVIHVHGANLHGARNTALGMVETPNVVFLDADDELEAGYIDAMLAADGDLRAPRVRYVADRKTHAPRFPRVAGHGHDCDRACISSGEGNWLVIGTCAPTQLLRDAGGWKDWPCYEDFDLWMRVLQLGATVQRVPAAIYRAFVRRDSRNRAPAMVEKNRVHAEIVAANGGLI